MNDLPSCVNSTLLLFADDTKLFRCIKSNFDVDQLQRDIDALMEWSKLWLLSFNISKCKHLRIGSGLCHASYTLDGVEIESVDYMRDLGVNIDANLKFHSHANSCVLKANRILSVIAKSFINLNSDMLPVLYKSLVRPVLEYGNLIWGPFYTHDQIQIEKVQKRASRLVTTVSDLPYTDRLSALNLPSLAYRRRRGDMIFLFQMLHGHVDIYVSNLFTPASHSATRGHNYKLFKPQSFCLPRSRFFAIRSVNDWNSLSENIVNATSISQFKQLLDHHWNNFLFVADYNY